MPRQVRPSRSSKSSIRAAVSEGIGAKSTLNICIGVKCYGTLRRGSQPGWSMDGSRRGSRKASLEEVVFQVRITKKC